MMESAPPRKSHLDRSTTCSNPTGSTSSATIKSTQDHVCPMNRWDYNVSVLQKTSLHSLRGLEKLLLILAVLVCCASLSGWPLGFHPDYEYSYEISELPPGRHAKTRNVATSNRNIVSVEGGPTKEQVRRGLGGDAKANNSNHTSVPSVPSVPYYLQGRTWKSWDLGQNYSDLETMRSIAESNITTMMIDVQSKHHKAESGWVLANQPPSTTRNHGSVLFEMYPSGRQVLTLILGRQSRAIQTIDLYTGHQHAFVVPETLVDPAGFRLNDLNHVYTVVVDSLDGTTKEIWSPCGFHGDAVNSEVSSEYARIIHMNNMSVTLGPKLAVAGGACVAMAVSFRENEPPHVCTFGGTHGSHNKGDFLPYSSCYDRVQQKWHFPFGRLPTGFDHGSVSFVPKGRCHPSDPARILIMNFRTKNYGTQSPLILAYDFPEEWTDQHFETSIDQTGPWYIFSNVSYSSADDEVNAPRDASGVVSANNGRFIVNMGGTHYEYDAVKKRRHVRYSTIRSFDICQDRTRAQWNKLGDLGAQTFAIQTSSSTDLNIAVSCGGQTFTRKDRNLPWCFVSRYPEVSFENDANHRVNEQRQVFHQYSYSSDY
eukprot:Nitzschia sp. Nitz4//scaffold178_size73299//32566//34477//NITZ4_005702-RA/size73299-snap-gene-0.143-mRNA-1//-1//CDS//3329539131//9220//frame0